MRRAAAPQKNKGNKRISLRVNEGAALQKGKKLFSQPAKKEPKAAASPAKGVHSPSSPLKSPSSPLKSPSSPLKSPGSPAILLSSASPPPATLSPSNESPKPHRNSLTSNLLTFAGNIPFLSPSGDKKQDDALTGGADSPKGSPDVKKKKDNEKKKETHKKPAIKTLLKPFDHSNEDDSLEDEKEHEDKPRHKSRKGTKQRRGNHNDFDDFNGNEGLLRELMHYERALKLKKLIRRLASEEDDSDILPKHERRHSRRKSSSRTHRRSSKATKDMCVSTEPGSHHHCNSTKDICVSTEPAIHQHDVKMHAADGDVCQKEHEQRKLVQLLAEKAHANKEKIDTLRRAADALQSLPCTTNESMLRRNVYVEALRRKCAEAIRKTNMEEEASKVVSKIMVSEPPPIPPSDYVGILKPPATRTADNDVASFRDILDDLLPPATPAAHVPAESTAKVVSTAPPREEVVEKQQLSSTIPQITISNTQQVQPPELMGRLHGHNIDNRTRLRPSVSQLPQCIPQMYRMPPPDAWYNHMNPFYYTSSMHTYCGCAGFGDETFDYQNCFSSSHSAAKKPFAFSTPMTERHLRFSREHVFHHETTEVPNIVQPTTEQPKPETQKDDSEQKDKKADAADVVAKPDIVVTKDEKEKYQENRRIQDVDAHFQDAIPLRDIQSPLVVVNIAAKGVETSLNAKKRGSVQSLHLAADLLDDQLKTQPENDSKDAKTGVAGGLRDHDYNVIEALRRELQLLNALSKRKKLSLDVGHDASIENTAVQHSGDDSPRKPAIKKTKTEPKKFIDNSEIFHSAISHQKIDNRKEKHSGSGEQIKEEHKLSAEMKNAEQLKISDEEVMKSPDQANEVNEESKLNEEVAMKEDKKPKAGCLRSSSKILSNDGIGDQNFNRPVAFASPPSHHFFGLSQNAWFIVVLFICIIFVGLFILKEIIEIINFNPTIEPEPFTIVEPDDNSKLVNPPTIKKHFAIPNSYHIENDNTTLITTAFATLGDSTACNLTLCTKECDYLETILVSKKDPCDNFYAYVCSSLERTWTSTWPSASSASRDILEFNQYQLVALQKNLKSDKSVLGIISNLCTADSTPINVARNIMQRTILDLGNNHTYWPTEKTITDESEIWRFEANIVWRFGVSTLTDVSLITHPEDKAQRLLAFGEPNFLYVAEDGPGRLSLAKNAFREMIAFMDSDANVANATRGFQGVLLYLASIASSPLVKSVEVDNVKIRTLSQTNKHIHTLFRNAPQNAWSNDQILIAAPSYLHQLSAIGSRGERYKTPYQLKDVFNLIGFMLLLKLVPFLSLRLKWSLTLFSHLTSPHLLNASRGSLCFVALENLFPDLFYDLITPSISTKRILRLIHNDMNRHLRKLAWLKRSNRNDRDFQTLIRRITTQNIVLIGQKSQTIRFSNNLAKSLLAFVVDLAFNQSLESRVAYKTSVFETWPRFERSSSTLFIPRTLMNATFWTSPFGKALQLSRVGVRTFSSVFELFFDSMVFAERDQRGNPVLFGDAYDESVNAVLNCLARSYRASEDSLKSLLFKTSPDHATAARKLLLQQTAAVQIAFHIFLDVIKENDVAFTGCSKWTDEQLFFIYFALDNCETGSRIKARNFRRHFRLPSQERVNVPLMHFQEFADVWKCKSASRMQALEKCLVLTS